MCLYDHTNLCGQRTPCENWLGFSHMHTNGASQGMSGFECRNEETSRENWEVLLEGETVTAANHMSGRTTEPCDKHRWAHNTGWNSICQGHTITGWDVGGAMSPDLKTDLQVSLS